MGFNDQRYVTEVLQDVLRQKENLYLGQLNDLITSGLIQVEEGPATLVNSIGNSRVEVRQAVKLTFMGYDKIKKLEEENQALRDELKNILGLKEELKNG